MFKSITLLATFPVFFASVALADGDDLFSSVRTDAVFAEGQKDATARTDQERLTAADSLRDLLNAAGFDAKVAGSRTVSLKKELSPWTFPVLLTISDDEAHVAIILGLQSIKDTTTLTSDVLLKMMEVSQKHAPAVVSYSSTRERTEIYSIVSNQGLTGLALRAEINRMAIIARDNSELWSPSVDDTAKAEEVSPVAPTTPPANPANTLVGRWSAAKSNTEAFAVEFKADGEFNLVYINNGKQTKSTGKFTRTDSNLTLAGSDGLKLSGTITMKSATEFDFRSGNTPALKFSKAK